MYLGHTDYDDGGQLSWNVGLLRRCTSASRKESNRQESYDPTRQMREWMRYTAGSSPGNDMPRLVTLRWHLRSVNLRSVWGNILGAASRGQRERTIAPSKVRVQGRFHDVTITRDGKSIPMSSARGYGAACFREVRL